MRGKKRTTTIRIADLAAQDMFKKFKDNPFLKFLLAACISYAAWYSLYHGYINPSTHFDRYVIDSLIDLSSWGLDKMGYTLIPEPPEAEQIRTVGIDGTYGLWIGDPCDGIALFALFTIFMVFYPGPLKQKLWFLPFGLITIHLINVLRIMALCIIVTYDYAYLDFNHNYTFTIIVYGYMFFLWILWAKKYADLYINTPSK